MINIFKAALNKLDLSYTFFYRNKSLILKLVLLLIVLWYVYTRVKSKPTKDITSVVNYLLSESARHVDSAVTIRHTNPLQAYERAIYGSVMARTAKDLADNKERLSRDLKVDVYKYLEYTNQVTSQIKESLK